MGRIHKQILKLDEKISLYILKLLNRYLNMSWCDYKQQRIRYPARRVIAFMSLRGANFPRYNYGAVGYIYACGNQIAQNYSIPLSAKSAN